MIPILYSRVTGGVVPSDYGIGALTDCISASVTEERNGGYELALEYPAQGLHADEIQPNRFIKAKPNFSDDAQIFRIYKVGKRMNGKFTVNAQHISYDLSGKLITSGTAASATAACLLLEGSADYFTITTDKSVSAPFEIREPSSVRSWFGGKAGSLLDVYGTAEWHYDNYDCELLSNRGADRGVEIRYGKNLTELSQEISMSNLCTGVLPYYVDAETEVKTIGTLVPTGLTLDVTRDVAIDFSSDVDPESATSITDQLTALANNYINNNILTRMMGTITLDFVQLSSLQERVDLCDTVHIYFEALDISTALKCVATTWDVLNERYTSTTFGDARVNIADTISAQQKTLQETPTISTMNKAVNRATDLISGNLGGYVVVHDSDNDGHPDEILIMDTDDINTAVKVWRWNAGGLGYSATGYAGPYSKIALTNDGQIVADAITTGTLNANLIKAGVISDVNGNSTIDMTTGVATLWQLIAKGYLTVEDENGNVVGTFSRGVGGSFFDLYNALHNVRVRIAVGGNDDGYIDVFDNNNNATISLAGLTGIVECENVKQRNGVVEIWSGTSYQGFNCPWDDITKFSSFLIYGQLSSTGSLIPMIVPRTMITTSEQKFIINDETHYATYMIKHDEQPDTFDIRFNTSDAGTSQRLRAIYGIY